jgi:hypothetical protein
MLDASLSKDEADAIYESPKYVSDESISWGIMENKAQKIDFEVITEEVLLIPWVFVYGGASMVVSRTLARRFITKL